MKQTRNRPGGRPGSWTSRLAACLVAIAAVPVAWSGSFEPPRPGSYRLPVVQCAGDGEVLDHTGAERRLRDLTRGTVTVMSFIYTRCNSAKACPFATGVLNQLHLAAGADPALAGKLRLLSLSFDPEHDTPARMEAYSQWARAREVPVPWHFLTTRSQQELKPVLEAYGQVVDRRRKTGDPRGPLSHVLRVYLIDAAGRVRNIYSSDTLDLRLVLGDVKTLLMEEAAGEPGAHP